MPKGYWIVNNVVHDLETYKTYQAANAEPFAKYGAKFLVRGGKNELMEGAGHPRVVVIEFESYDAAMDCYKSPEYQAAKALRDDVSEANLIIVEGYDG